MTLNALPAAAWLTLLVLTSGLAVGQKSAEPATLASILNGQLKYLEHDLVITAEAMPEEKFGFAPTAGEFKGVRSFAQQIKHVAATNYLVAAAILEEKPPASVVGEDGPESMTSRKDVLQFLRDSFAYAHKAVTTINEKNATGAVKNPFGSRPTTRLDMSAELIGHGFNHYGQMVEYLRMNGIIPPTSRGQ